MTSPPDNEPPILSYLLIVTGNISPNPRKTFSHFFKNMEKTSSLVVNATGVGSILSAIYTTLTIYAYCKFNGIMFLMPTVFLTISFKTFFLFVIPLLFVLFIPVSLGVLGAVTDCIKEKKDVIQKEEGDNSKGRRGKLVLISIVTIILIIILSQYYSSFSVLIFLIVLFIIIYLINSFVYIFFINEKLFPYRILDFIIRVLITTFGGFLGIFLYFEVLKTFPTFKQSIYEYFFILMLPLILSTGSFGICISGMKKILPTILSVAGVIFLFISIHITLSNTFSNWYFHQMSYGDIPAVIVRYENAKEKNPISSVRWTILFNSGSELYVRICPPVKIDHFSKCDAFYKQNIAIPLRVKPSKKENITTPSFELKNMGKIIRISYKDLETIPNF